ncbi:MAG: methionine synthase [Candidatus Cloacimonadota bacterium]|nr:MAG: methionine synthase [Candidatus Cloacimonadota bacterium]
MYDELLDLMSKKVLLIDGAMGTCIQGFNLEPSDFGHEDLDGCNENLNETKPEIIQDIHEQYFKAGSDIVETNSFGSTPLVMDEYDLSHEAYNLSKKSAQIAKKAAINYTTKDQKRYVAGSMGPTTKAISVTGGVTFEKLVESYEVQARGLIDGGVDFLLLETTQDTVNLKAGIEGVHQAIINTNKSTPLMISVTIEPTGTMLAGQGVEALTTSLSHLPLLGLGMNCSTGPEFMTSHVRDFSELSPFPVFCMPNAGLPNEDGEYCESPQDMGIVIKNFAKNGWLNILGGCCGTSPTYIEYFDEIRSEFIPRVISPKKGSFVSGIDFLEMSDDIRPILVGERTNVIGSRKFKRLISEEKWEEAAEVGRKQVKGGAQIVDICLGNPDREEIEDMRLFLPEILKKVRVPIMLDSTDDKFFEEFVPIMPGKSIINSVNLEDGEERFDTISKLINRHGGSLVVGLIDEDPEQGMAVCKERKIEIATRSYDLLVNKYGVCEEDIIFDPLVFPCGTGDEAYITSAGETVHGIKLIREKFPKCKMILGISNVSFGLPPAGREVLNSVFLYHCTKSGLDLAIVNSQKIERYSSIGEIERALCEELIYNNSKEAVNKFVDHFRDKKVKSTAEDLSHLSVEDRLKINLVEGTKENLIANLDEALKKYTPLKVINIPLMAGMGEVGRLFNANELIVAEVLQSASVMKAAVTHLEGFMEKGVSNKKAKFLLATVKGDVHDIGKNLVEIILGNNGYEIINLGIKIPPEKIIAACREHKPDYVGLSGLLVKSALMMVDTAKDMKAAGIDIPILVGGAALSRTFCDKRIQPEYDGNIFYAVDAMTGLDIVNNLSDTLKIEAFKEKYKQVGIELAKKKAKVKVKKVKEKYIIDHNEIRESPTDFSRSFFEAEASKVFDYVNDQFFYTKHMGFKGSIRLSCEKGDKKALKLKSQVEELKKMIIENNWIKPKAVFQFFNAHSNGNKVETCGDNGNVIKTLEFPREIAGEDLCISDFIAPSGKKVSDTMAMFIVTTGNKIHDIAEEYKDKGDFFTSHCLLALAMESAEAMAEMMHEHIRKLWGMNESLTMKDLVQTKYQGIRLSFGYPACPNLEDQEILFDLLKPQEIGVELTDGHMMEPENSVSAICFSHPKAKYFSID